MQDFKFSRCPRTETARIVVQNELSDPPQLIVIHTGTNDLTMTTPVDAFISDLSIMITEASRKFPMSKIIYSTLLPRADLPSHLISKINKQIADGCSKLPNVHIVTHENLLAKESVDLHGDRHIEKATP